MFYVYLVNEGFMVWNGPSTPNFPDAHGFPSMKAARIAGNLRKVPFIILEAHIMEA